MHSHAVLFFQGARSARSEPPLRWAAFLLPWPCFACIALHSRRLRANGALPYCSIVQRVAARLFRSLAAELPHRGSLSLGSLLSGLFIGLA